MTLRDSPDPIDLPSISVVDSDGLPVDRLTWCGIGHEDSFRRSLERCGHRVVDSVFDLTADAVTLVGRIRDEEAS